MDDSGYADLRRELVSHWMQVAHRLTIASVQLEDGQMDSEHFELLLLDQLAPGPSDSAPLELVVCLSALAGLLVKMYAGEAQVDLESAFQFIATALELP